MPCYLCLIDIVLHLILKEVKATNNKLQDLDDRVTSVETKLEKPDVKEGQEKGKRATPPSRQLRV